MYKLLVVRQQLHLQCLDVLEAAAPKAGHCEHHGPHISWQLWQAEVNLQVTSTSNKLGEISCLLGHLALHRAASIAL